MDHINPGTVLTGLALGAIVLVTVVCNSLVLITYFIYRKIQTVTNLYLVSLATSDLLLALLVLPLAIIMKVTGSWSFGQAICDAWVTLDVMLCTASILNLCCISFDRLFAFERPLWYRAHRSKKFAYTKIALVWILAFITACPPVLGWREQDRGKESSSCSLIQNKAYIIFSSLFSFYLPFIFLVLANIRIGIIVYRQTQIMSSHCQYSLPCEDESLQMQDMKPSEASNLDLPKTCKTRTPKHSDTGTLTEEGQRNHYVVKSSSMNFGFHRKQSSLIGKRHSQILSEPHRGGTNLLSERQTPFSPRHLKTARSLFLVVGCFIVCWLPFFILYLLGAFCENCTLNTTLVQFFTWLGYCNSTVNPFLYALCNDKFRLLSIWKLRFKIINLK